MGRFPELTPVHSQTIGSWFATLEAGDITWAMLCQIVTSRPPLGTQSHLSSGFDDVWVVYHEPLDVSGGRCGTPSSDIGVPAGYDTVNLRALEVGYFANRG